MSDNKPPSGSTAADESSNATGAPDTSAAGPSAAPPGDNATAGTSDALAAMTAERDRYKDAALRAMADLDNYRKRARRDADESVRKAREDVLRELLPVFDNLERAAQYVGTGADVNAIGKGIEMVLRLFEDTLSKLGGKRLRPVGQPFDPTQHEAIQQIESAEHPAGTVAREEIAGYMFNDRLLRPAMVVVSRGTPSGSGGDGSGQS